MADGNADARKLAMSIVNDPAKTIIDLFNCSLALTDLVVSPVPVSGFCRMVPVSREAIHRTAEDRHLSGAI